MAGTSLWSDYKMNDGISAKSNIAQDNGQVIYMSPLSESIPPPKGTEVFISQLPPSLTIEELLPVAEKCGTVYALRLMMDFSGVNRGFAFVRYVDIESTRKALISLTGYEILPNCRIRVQRSLDNCRLFIGQIRKTLKKEELSAILEKETEGLKEVILYLSSTDKNLNRGFCFAEYVDHRAAAMARRKLINLEKIYSWAPYDAQLKVDWAIPEEYVDDDVMSKVKIVYIRNMMLRTTESSLRDVITRVVSPSDVLRICKVQDFAFVHFKDRDSALIAISHLKGFNLDGALLEATWAKPPPPKEEHSREHKKLARKMYPASQGKHPASPPIEKPLLNGGNYVQPVIGYSVSHIVPKVGNRNDVWPITLTQTYNRDADRITISQCSPLKSSNGDYLTQIMNFFLTTYPPSTALISIFQYFQWGNIGYKIYMDTLPGNKTIYISQVWNNDYDHGIGEPAPPAETQIEATNNSALIFLKKNFYTILYNARVPMNV